MVKIIRDDWSEDTYVDARLIDARRLIDVSFESGEPLGRNFPDEVRILVESEGEPNDYFVAGPMPVVSERVRGVFDSFHANVEYHPLVVMLHDGRPAASRYYFPNFLDSIDCLDWDASSFTWDEDFATDLRVLVLKPTTQGVPVFRVARTTASLICVQEEVAHALDEAGCKGLVLLSPSQWKNPGYPS